MLFSVITVCYQCKDALEVTACSVLAQSLADYEYLIIDGGSTDGTAELAKEYASRDSRMTVVSEPDGGIYDAMNKGTGLAKGQYILFLNAGDVFVSDTVLEQVKAALEKEPGDIYFGDVRREGRIVRQNRKPTLFRLIYLEWMVCHQSIFAKRQQCKEDPFDMSLKICADRDWLIRRLKAGARVCHLHNLLVCDYDTSGVSSNYGAFQGESLRIAETYGGKKAVLFVKIKRAMGRLLGHRYC